MTFWTQKSGANFKIEVGPCLKFIEAQGFCKLKLSENLISTEESIVKSLTREDIEMMLN